MTTPVPILAAAAILLTHTASAPPQVQAVKIEALKDCATLLAFTPVVPHHDHPMPAPRHHHHHHHHHHHR
jgi:hypothetical protein